MADGTIKKFKENVEAAKTLTPGEYSLYYNLVSHKGEALSKAAQNTLKKPLAKGTADEDTNLVQLTKCLKEGVNAFSLMKFSAPIIFRPAGPCERILSRLYFSNLDKKAPEQTQPVYDKLFESTWDQLKDLEPDAIRQILKQLGRDLMKRLPLTREPKGETSHQRPFDPEADSYTFNDLSEEGDEEDEDEEELSP